MTVGFRSARRTLRFFETESDAAAADDEEVALVKEEVIDAVEDVEDMVVRTEENYRDLEPCCPHLVHSRSPGPLRALPQHAQQIKTGHIDFRYTRNIQTSKPHLHCQTSGSTLDTYDPQYI